MDKGALRRRRIWTINLLVACCLTSVFVSSAYAATGDSSASHRSDAPRLTAQTPALLVLWGLRSEVIATAFTTNSDTSATDTSTGAVTGGLSTPTLSTTSTGQSETVSSSFLQGTYMGPADPAGVKSFAAATSTDVTIASDYLPANNGWAGMDGANGSINWLTNGWKDSGYVLSLGVPIIPTNASGAPQGSLGQGALGSYNGYFTTLANTLVAAGDGNAYLRLGWEFDGNWYAWQAQSLTAEEQYAAYFRQIVTAMRSVQGAAFRFVWNPDAGAFSEAGYSVMSAYPGSAYVDIIGLDLYDMSWSTPATPQNAWTSTYLPELSAAQNFAQSEGKPIAFCEWGALIRPADHGLGDDPLYINSMIDWMKVPSHNVAYESYFNSNTLATGGGADQNLIGVNFSNSRAAFIGGLS